MKIPFIKFNNHPILRNLNLDFKKDCTKEIVVCKADDFIAKHKLFSKYYFKESNNNGTKYSTLPTYIRNTIHHPDNSKTFSEERLELSIELLVKLHKD